MLDFGKCNYHDPNVPCRELLKKIHTFPLVQKVILHLSRQMFHSFSANRESMRTQGIPITHQFDWRVILGKRYRWPKTWVSVHRFASFKVWMGNSFKNKRHIFPKGYFSMSFEFFWYVYIYKIKMTLNKSTLKKPTAAQHPNDQHAHKRPVINSLRWPLLLCVLCSQPLLTRDCHMTHWLNDPKHSRVWYIHLHVFSLMVYLPIICEFNGIFTYILLV